ncbi:MAG: hypothetical protein ABEI06_00455 [Halobacteriaceae archaeon]
MKFHTQYRRNPSREQARNLTEYIANDRHRGGIVVDRAGEITDEDINGFALYASRCHLIRLHTATFRETYEPKMLANTGRAVARNYLDGLWLVGVHVSNPENPHIHIAQAGTTQEVWMDPADIREVRSAIADRVGESCGELSKSKQRMPSS